jgi:hypothetical protein
MYGALFSCAYLSTLNSCGSVYTFRLHLHTFTRFKQDVRVSISIIVSVSIMLDIFSHFLLQFIFTTGLALSTTVDILITASLFFLLQTSRTGAATFGICPYLSDSLANS